MESDAWPNGHLIGVYLSTGDAPLLVGTAAARGNLSRLFRHLADEWDRMQENPDRMDDGLGFYFPEATTSAGSLGARGA